LALADKKSPKPINNANSNDANHGNNQSIAAPFF
jgi:hypothetical protein